MSRMISGGFSISVSLMPTGLNRKEVNKHSNWHLFEISTFSNFDFLFVCFRLFFFLKKKIGHFVSTCSLARKAACDQGHVEKLLLIDSRLKPRF